MPSDGERRERVVVLQHLGHGHGPRRANFILQSMYLPPSLARTSHSPPRVRACVHAHNRTHANRRKCTHARGCAMRRVELYIA